MENRLHIAQFIHRYPPALGGAESYTARLCNFLSQRGDDVRVWTSTAIELQELWQRPRARNHPTQTDGIEDSCPAGTPRIQRYRPVAFPARRWVFKALSLVPIKRWQCLMAPCNPICPDMWADVQRFDGPLDAVHACAFPYSFPIMCGLRLARRRGVPFFLTPFLHLGDPNEPHDSTRRQYTRSHLRWLLRQADGVFVQTHCERAAVLSLGVAEERVLLQGLGVEARECSGGQRGRLRAEWEVRPDEIVVGHLANNSNEKGTCDLLRAAERLWLQGKRFRVVLAGPEMPNFQAFWNNFAPKTGVVKMGVLNAEQKRNFFAAIDLFALPSRTDSFGLVLLEAWANRKPNLVYRAGGPGELVRAQIDGLQARCGDIQELTAQLARLIAAPELRRDLGERGFARIHSEFQWPDKLELVRNALASAALSASLERACGVAPPRITVPAE